MNLDPVEGNVHFSLRHRKVDPETFRFKVLPEHHEYALNQICEKLGDGLHQIVLAGGNYNEKQLGGHAQVLKSDARFSPAFTIPTNVDGQVWVQRLYGVPTSAKKLKEEYQPLMEKRLKQLTKEHYPEASVSECFNPDGHVDASPWKLQLNDGHVGIYTLKTNELGGNIPFMIVHNTAGKKMRDELADIVQRENLTAEEFATDPRRKWVEEQTRRNTAGIMAQMLDAIGETHASNIERDIDANVPEHHLPRQLAKMQAGSSYNTSTVLSQGKSGETKAVVFHNHVGDATKLKESAFVYSGPYNPITELQMNVVGNKTSRNKFHNIVPAFGVPLTKEQTAEIMQNLDHPMNEQMHKVASAVTIPSADAHPDHARYIPYQAEKMLTNADKRSLNINEHARPRSYEPVFVLV